MAVTITLDQLGAELRRIREERGRSLRQVEEETGISPATLSRIERGSRPELPIVDKLAQWLDINVATVGDTAGAIKTDADLKRTIAVHLRANRNLSEEVAQAIIESFDLIMEIEVERARRREANR